MSDPRPVRLSLADILSLGSLGIRTRRARATLSALGISIGIATLVMVTAIPAAGQRDLLARLSALGTNVLVVQGSVQQQPPVLLPLKSESMVERIGPVTQVAAVANTHAEVHRSSATEATDFSGLTVLAANADLMRSLNGRLASGHFLDRGTARYPTAVLGSVAARRLGILQLSPGRTAPQIAVAGRYFTVIGVLQKTPLSPEIDRSVIVGWQAAQEWLAFDGHPTVLYLKAREDAVEDVQQVLGRTLNPVLPGAVQVDRPADALTAKRATESTLSALFLGLAAVALLVGGIGVANTMVVAVLERRTEVGLRRALGASRGQIRVQFLTESILLSALGGLLGILLGSLGSTAYAAWRDWPLVFPWTAICGGFTGAVLIGAAAGVYPSVRAARLSPATALAAA